MGNPENVPLTLEEKITQAIRNCNVELDEIEKIVKAVLEVLPKYEEKWGDH